MGGFITFINFLLVMIIRVIYGHLRLQKHPNGDTAMRLASITLPLLDNHGMSLAFVHDYLEIQLLDIFGGFTKLPAQGAWKNPATGKIYRDSSFVYQVATTQHAEESIFDIAKDVCKLAAQKCIFVVDTAGNVNFVEPETANVPTANLLTDIDNAFGAGELNGELIE